MAYLSSIKEDAENTTRTKYIIGEENYKKLNKNKINKDFEIDGIHRSRHKGRIANKYRENQNRVRGP